MRRRVQLSTALILVFGCGSGPISPPPGVLVDVGGHKMHIRCLGPLDTKPTIILEAGGGDYSNRWSRVQELLSPRMRTCAYDRAGSGWSEPGPAPRTMRQEVSELHALVDNARVSPPYILVGHSIGGLLVRLYVERYGSDVIALVLVDPTHENGWVFHRTRGESRPQVVSLGDVNEEAQQIYLSRNTNPEPLGNRPLIVLAAARPVPAPPGLSDEKWNELQQQRAEDLTDLARLSRNSKLVRDPSSGHRIQVDNPELVARAIKEVMTAALDGVRLRE